MISGQTISALFTETGYAFDIPPHVQAYEVTREVLKSLCAASTPQHVAAVVRTPCLVPPDTYPDGFIVILDNVQDPGNAGAIVRSAHAFGAAGLLFSCDSADPFSDKALRASMGSSYHLPIWRGNAATEIVRMKETGTTVVCADLRGADTMPVLSLRTALVIGSEGRGASEKVLSLCDVYRIKMPGNAESLNASVAAGILLYEIAKEMSL